jgi:threonine dehydratase
MAIAVKSRKPSAKIFGVEPNAVPKLLAAMKAGKIVSLPVQKTAADGLIPPAVGDLTLEACMKHVSKVFTVTEEEIMTAMKLLIRDAHIFPEPSAAVTAAALIAGRETNGLGKRVVLVITGGNVSLNLLARNLST